METIGEGWDMRKIALYKIEKGAVASVIEKS